MIGQRLRDFRKVKKITQEELANVLNLDTANISFYENGKTAPSLQSLEIMRITYNLNINWLLSGEGTMFLDSEKDSKKDNNDAIDKDTIDETKDKLIEKLKAELENQKKKNSLLEQTNATQYNTIQQQSEAISKLAESNSVLVEANIELTGKLVKDIITPSKVVKPVENPA